MWLVLLIEHSGFLATNLEVKKIDEASDKIFKKVIPMKGREA